MMCRTVAGVSALGVILGVCAGSSLAQQAFTTPGDPKGTAASSRGPRSSGLQRVASQNIPQVPPPSVPPPPVPPPPTATEAPPAAPGATEPLQTNRDLALPKSEREGGGGEPTTATAEAEAPAEGAAAKDPTKLLMNALGREEAPVKVYGWIQNSFTGNTLGTPKNSLNFGVNPNFLANRWMGNQYYLIFENPLEQGDEINFGFRIDNLFGNDWVFNHMRGLFEHSFQLNHFAGYDPAQMYAEVHLPWITKGGLDVKGGRFYTILGYEVVPATGRPLLSVPYMFNYGQPFTHFGFLSTLHVTDRVNWYNGAVNGWDRWIDQNYKWNYLGGVTWTSKDGKAALALSYIFGPDQYPRFLRANTPIVLPGTTFPPYLAGHRNIGYGGNWRTMFTTVFTYKWTDKITQVIETDEAIEKNVPGLGVGGASNDASWYSFGNWFLYSFNEKIMGVWRAEVFWDESGVRTGQVDVNTRLVRLKGDRYYEMTLGAQIKPYEWLWIRPEARYDWSQFHPAYSGETRKSQLTLAFDVIFLF